MQLSKKYDIPSLMETCVKFMDTNLEISNVFTILENSLFFEENDLVSKCIWIIEQNTPAAFNSDSFLGISQSTLTYILGNDYLNMEEIDIFKRSCAWAESKNQTKPVRHVLGKALYKIRFPTMTLSEFTNVVRKTDVLNMEEQNSIYAYLSVPDDVNKPSQFGCNTRTVRKSFTWRCIELIATPVHYIYYTILGIIWRCIDLIATPVHYVL